MSGFRFGLGSTTAAEMLSLLERLHRATDPLPARLAGLISRPEVSALTQRCEDLLTHRRMPLAALCRACEDAGFAEARNYLSTGNILLRSGSTPAVVARRVNALIAGFGRYPAMFERLLGPGFDYASYDVAAGALPSEPGEHDAYLITGSSAGVYDRLPWIEPLLGFIRSAR